MSETLFFSSGAKVSSKNEYSFSFKMSDLQSTFKIRVQSYGVFGPSFATQKIRVADPFTFSFKLPELMVKGDTHNITMVISNFNSNWTVYTPSVTNTDSNIAVSFNYLIKNATGTNMIVANTYNVSANTTAYTAVFTVTALKATERATVRVVLTGTTPDGNHTF